MGCVLSWRSRQRSHFFPAPTVQSSLVALHQTSAIFRLAMDGQRGCSLSRRNKALLTNWIQTISGKGWFIILRLCSPLEPFFTSYWLRVFPAFGFG
jgi:16S rRNA A1518/A1519 N6-dimethyltransferase RsmA/KsgA/DIM1 with predicted DNA glycosylase/AP lyase activity